MKKEVSNINCLYCRSKIKIHNFEMLLTLTPRYLCANCETSLQPEFQIQDHLLICFKDSKRVEEFMSQLNQGDSVLMLPLLEMIKRKGSKTFKCYDIELVIKDDLSDEVHEILSKELISTHKGRAKLKLKLF